MSDWGRGYVTDIAYIPGYYRQQAPVHMALACLLGGVAPAMPEEDAPYHYLELGCGRGFGALVLAASNPGWRVTAIDFHPAHIAEGREWAQAAGLTNITFVEADLSSLAEDRLADSIPQADAVSLHGVWSWVPPAVRDGIVRLLREKVAPGGMVHVSYNSLPAWQGGLAMQRVMREVGVRLPVRSDRQIAAGLAFLQELDTAGCLHVNEQRLVQTLLPRMAEMPLTYLAHEYMNEHWQPCFHADVVAALGGAKLEFVASAVLTENFPELTLTEPQRELYRRYEDPVLRELVKDMCLSRALRHDVYSRGARPIPVSERDRMLRQMTLGLIVAADSFEYEAALPAGTANLGEAFYRPVVAALAERPRRIGELLDLPGGGTRDNPAELAGVMVGLDRAIVMLRPQAAPAASAARLNRVIAERLGARPETLNQAVALASATVGSGVQATAIDAIVAWRMQLGETVDRLDDWVIALAAGLPGDAQQAVRAALLRAATDNIPMLRSLGVVA